MSLNSDLIEGFEYLTAVEGYVEDKMPLYKGFLEVQDQRKPRACIKQPTVISDAPKNMIEGLGRLYHLEKWIRADRSVNEFYDAFGSPIGG